MNSFCRRIRSLASIACLLTGLNVSSAADRPNVIMIMTDNHGAWTLGCYGNQDIRTPNIDRLAAEGTLFENAFASNPVCSPTRATTLTGLLPSQHGVHCFLRANRLQVGPDARNTLAEFRSLPEILKDRGYRCGLVGKWHLGANLSPQEGLSDYWITMPHGGTSTFYDAQVIEDGKIRTEPGYLTDFWTDHAVKFIHQQTREQPFFLFLSYNGPYALSRLLLREGRNRHAEFYRNAELPSFPREKAHPWQLHNLDYINNPTSIRRVATEVSGVDDGVGRILQTLESAGLDDNTLIVFLADQGWVGGHDGFFGMGDHTHPVTARDGMMRIPLILRQPGKVAAGRRSESLVSNYDLLPTLLDHLNIDEPTTNRPGRSFAKQLDTQRTASSPFVHSAEAHAAVYYEFETLRCIRTPSAKYVHRYPNGPHELYNLEDDPSEFHNLIDEQPQVAAELRAQLFRYFDKHADPKYDLWKGGDSQTARYTQTASELPEPHDIDTPPHPDGFEPHEFSLPDGFSAKLVAGPPLVRHPTMGCFDDQGRLYVCNNAGVNLSAAELEQQLPNGIVRLEDIDGDGDFEKSTPFADGMTFPMGAAWHDGALFVASPPYIWRLEDTDDDGIADVRTPIVKKFGYTGNAASIHGCFLHPNGRLYWCDGYHGHEFKDAEGNVVSQRKGSYLFSCRTDGSDVRIHCGGGMDNPVEVDFTDEGDVIGTVNILYSRPRVDALVHWQLGGAYPHRTAVLDELSITGGLLEPIHRFGHVAVSGATRYRSGAMDHRWRDDFFVTFFNHGKVVRTELKPHGSSYTVTQREFLSCQSRDFHPTDVIEDADGSLLVVDTGGWFYRGCPTSQMARPDVLGGIYRVTRDGMTTIPDPRGQSIDWAQRSDSQLMRDLKDTRYEVRNRAVREAADREGDGIDRLLARTVQTADLPARQNALWSIARRLSASNDSAAQSTASNPQTEHTGGLRAAAVSALQDRSASVRRIACNVLQFHPDSNATAALVELLQDDDLSVRRAAAEALGQQADQSVVQDLAPLTGSDDRSLAHAATHAMMQLGGLPKTDLASVSPEHHSQIIRLSLANVQVAPQQVLITGTPICDWPDSVPLQQELLTYYRYLWQRATGHDKSVATFNQAHLETIRTEIGVAFEDLLSGVQSKRLPQETLIQFVAEFSAVPSVKHSLNEHLSDAELPKSVRASLLAGVSRARVEIQPAWVQPIVAELQDENPLRVRSALQSLAAIGAAAFRDELLKISQDRGRSTELRLLAVEALLRLERRLSDELSNFLFEVAEAGKPSDQSTVIRLLGSASLTPSQIDHVLTLIPTTSAPQLRDLLPVFQRSLPAETAKQFLDVLAQSQAFQSLSVVELSEVVKRFPVPLHDQANELLQQLKKLETDRLTKLDALVGNLGSGDADAGRDLFFGIKAKCGECHRIGDRGRRIGPDLSQIGANRSGADLLESMLFPSASIVRQYEPWVVLTTEGLVYHGLVVEESDTEIHLQQASGEPKAILRADIEELRPATASIMPTGLEKTLTSGEMLDIVAWLQTLK